MVDLCSLPAWHSPRYRPNGPHPLGSGWVRGPLGRYRGLCHAGSEQRSTMNVYVLGRHLGTAMDHDNPDPLTCVYYSFVPDKGIDIPATDLTIDLLHGWAIPTQHDGGGEISQVCLVE